MDKYINKIIHGDTLEIMDELIKKEIKVDMILTDLPYGTTQNEWDSIIPLNELWERYSKIIKEDGIVVLTAQPPFDKVLGASNIKQLKYEIIWVKSKKTGHLNAKKMPLKQHENILIFYKKLPTYNPQGLYKLNVEKIRKGRHNGSNYGDSAKDAVVEFENYPSDVIFFESEKNPVHPTQKPVELGEYLIKTYTKESEIVLDNTCGSGSFPVAAANTNRKFIGIEKETSYVEIARKRVEEALNSRQLNLF